MTNGQKYVTLPPPHNFMMWNSDFSITEPDLILAEKNGTLKSIRLLKNKQDCYMFVQLSWRKDQELFLATTRSKKMPRRFRNIDRLIEYIETRYPSVKTISLELQQP